MNNIRKKILLKEFTAKKAVNSDMFLKLGINQSGRLLPYDDINKILNANDRFIEERNNSSFYRILGTINANGSNALFNLNDTFVGANNAFTWSVFNDMAFLDSSYPKDNDLKDPSDLFYSTSIQRNLIEKDGWFGYYDPDITKKDLCNFFDMEPKRERFSFVVDTTPYHTPKSTTSYVNNWDLTITYPYYSDKNHNMVNGGLLIVETVQVTVATRTMVAFGMACKHNLTIGDIVRITGTTGYDGDFVVVRTGLDNGDLKEYYFVIDLKPTGTINLNSRIKKIIDGVESQYYFRKFRRIKTRNSSVIETDDYETYGLSFSENIYTDKITQFVFNEDIDVDGLVDNLGRPLSEIYFTAIKTNSNGLFSSVSSGIESPFINKLNNSGISYLAYLRDIPVIQKIHNGGISATSLPFPSHIPLETNVNINDTDFYGDLVEFNTNQLLEIVLADVQHRFNTLNRESSIGNSQLTEVTGIDIAASGAIVTTTISLGPRQEGYYYKPHNLMKIREYSSYIETGDINTGYKPSYAIDMGDGRFLWRDLLTIGTSETEKQINDIPFLNGCHYLYQNYCFNIKRQDPFNQWDLFYTNFPPDPIGQSITNQFGTNSEEIVC